MSSSRQPTPSPSSSTSPGRERQRQRTRQLLLQAAQELVNQGHATPSLPDIAEHAGISRATAYRYFGSAEAVLHDALFDRAVPDPAELFDPKEDAADAASRAARSINALLLNDEVGLHVIERSFMQTWLEQPPGKRVARPGRRMRLIEPLVEGLADRLDVAARQRLRTALALIMGSEAALSLSDVVGGDREAGIAASEWAAKALVSQALLEAGEDPPPRS